MKTSTVTKRKRAPKPTSDRKRPNKTFIQQMAEFRGHMTGNEKTQLITLEVKNRLARINTRAMSEDESINFNSTDNLALQKLMRKFVHDIDNIIKIKKLVN